MSFIDLTRECIDLTSDQKMIEFDLEAELERERTIKEKLSINPMLCDIRQITNRSRLLLALWKDAGGSSQSDLLNQEPTYAEAQNALNNGPIDWFQGVQFFRMNLLHDLVDFKDYDKKYGGTGAGQRCVATLLTLQRAKLLF